MALIVTGSFGIDTVETPSGNAVEVAGGSCLYFATAASFFTRARVVGAVGEDWPDAFTQQLRPFDIDLQGLEMRMGSKTFRWHGKYHENMNIRDTVAVELNVLAEALAPVPDGYRDSEYVFLANTDPQSQLTLLNQFPGRKLAVADTMDLWINTQKDGLLELMRNVDGLVLNDGEALLLTGESNLVVAADRILELGPKFVVIKKGEHGCLLRHADGSAALPAWPARNVEDPTGAGDSFAGGMMGYLAEQGDISLPTIRRALGFGSVVASYNIESFSFQRLERLTRAEIEQRFEQYKQLVDLGG